MVNRWTLFLIIIIIGIIAMTRWMPLPTPEGRTHPKTEVLGNQGREEVAKEQPKEEVRAAIDMGSGATSLKVAKIDLVNNKIISVIFEKSIPVAYQKSLEQSSNNTFDQAVMDQGIATIQTLKDLALQHQAKKVVGVATAAFRAANNAQEFVSKVKEKTGVQVRIISQDEEGILALRGALAVTSIDPKNALIWDIGGGSMQLTTLTDSGTYLVEKGALASIPFKNKIIDQIEHKDSKNIHTPNPMNANDVQAAVELAQRAAYGTDPFIKEKIKRPETQIIAVGSLFKYGVKPVVDNQSIFSQDKLYEGITPLIGMTDGELKEHGLTITEVALSNPLLVLGYMKELNIKEAKIIDVNNADGALTYPVYWE